MHAINRGGVKICCGIRQHDKTGRQIHVICESAAVVMVNAEVWEVVGVKLGGAESSQILIHILPVETSLTKYGHIYSAIVHRGVKGMVTI